MLFFTFKKNVETKKSTENCSLSHSGAMTSGPSPVPSSSSLLHLSTRPGTLALGARVAPYLDVHPGPAQKAQCGVSSTVSPQRHLLLQLLQALFQLGPPAGEGVWRAVPVQSCWPEGWQGRPGQRERFLGSGAVRAGLVLTCASPAHCAQTCQCQGEWGKGVSAAAHTLSPRLPGAQNPLTTDACPQLAQCGDLVLASGT